MSCRQFPWYSYRTHIARHLVIPKAAKWLNHPKSHKNLAVKLAPNVLLQASKICKTLFQHSDTSILLISLLTSSQTSFTRTNFSFLGLRNITFHCIIFKYSRRKLDFLDLVKTLCRKSSRSRDLIYIFFYIY